MDLWSCSDCPSQETVPPTLQIFHKVAVTTVLIDYPQQLHILKVEAAHKTKQTSTSQLQLGWRHALTEKTLAADFSAFSMFRGLLK